MGAVVSCPPDGPRRHSPRRCTMSGKKVVIAVAVLAGIALAGASAQHILFPQMTPEKGTFEQPAGVLAKKPSTAWSATTVAAAVDGKPLPGHVATVVGEIIDYSCYLQL